MERVLILEYNACLADAEEDGRRGGEGRGHLEDRGGRLEKASEGHPGLVFSQLHIVNASDRLDSIRICNKTASGWHLEKGFACSRRLVSFWEVAAGDRGWWNRDAQQEWRRKRTSEQKRGAGHPLHADGAARHFKQSINRTAAAYSNPSPSPSLGPLPLRAALSPASVPPPHPSRSDTHLHIAR